MKIDQQTKETWIETLHRSREVMLEIGAFGLYLPKEDRVLHVIRPRDLFERDTEKMNLNSLDYAKYLNEWIRAFNNGEVNHITLGCFQYRRINRDVKVFGYHTHPADEQTCAPSKYDSLEVFKRASPLEVILSGVALEWTDTPFIAGYHPNFFPKPEKDISKIPLNRMEEEAKKMNIPSAVLFEMAYAKYHTGLYPSLNIEVV